MVSKALVVVFGERDVLLLARVILDHRFLCGSSSCLWTADIEDIDECMRRCILHLAGADRGKTELLIFVVVAAIAVPLLMVVGPYRYLPRSV